MPDHIDGDGLNNQRLNLRQSTKSQNNMNTNKGQGYSSKYKGVTWDKARKKWKCGIKINGKQIFIGRFIEEDDAALAYNQKASELFGEFSRLNVLEK